jgi:hypothetical protein
MATALEAADARAEPGQGARWVVEVDGSACVKQRAGFERELMLACEAMATCHVTSRRDAELEATLRCLDDGSWWLETRTVEGTTLTSVALSGATPEDRLREAAVEIARDVAPERALAAETLRHTLVPDGDYVPRPKAATTPKLAVLVGGIANASRGEATTAGARAGLGYRVTTRSHLTWSIAGALGGGPTLEQLRRLRTGVGLGWGAPFTAVPIGVAVEAGIAATQRYVVVDHGADTVYQALTSTTGYAQASLFAQVPLRSVRPYAAGTMALLTDGLITAGGEVGMTFPLF